MDSSLHELKEQLEDARRRLDAYRETVALRRLADFTELLQAAQSWLAWRESAAAIDGMLPAELKLAEALRAIKEK